MSVLLQSTLNKYPSEVLHFGFDFGQRSEIEVSGETLTGTPVVTATLQSGGGTLTLGAPEIVGNQVRVLLTGGTLGAIFKLVCSVQTNAGHTLATARLLRVSEPDIEP